jgi:hypothetical protein
MNKFLSSVKFYFSPEKMHESDKHPSDSEHSSDDNSHLSLHSDEDAENSSTGDEEEKEDLESDEEPFDIGWPEDPWAALKDKLVSEEVTFKSFMDATFSTIMEHKTYAKMNSMSYSSLRTSEPPSSTPDVDADGKRVHKPSLDWLSNGVPPGLIGGDWELMIKPESKLIRSLERKAFTTFMNFLVNHPFLERFALPRRLTGTEKSAKTTAIADVVHLVYTCLWHYRVKFGVVRQKTKAESMSVEVPSAAKCKVLIRCIMEAINTAIRAKASARRTTEVNNLKRQAVVRNYSKIHHFMYI